jgi:pimeloyl-ACP methyl ester carboxylesterase
LDYLGIEKASVIGASFGGRVALDFALAHPEVASALVLEAAALGGYKFESAEMLEFLAAEEEALARGDLVAATELNLRMWVDGIGRNPEDIGSAIRERVREMQMNTFSQPQPADATEKELEPPAIVRLSSIAIPALIVVGDKDVAEFRTISELIARGVQHGKLAVMPGAGHLTNMEKPAEFNRLVRDFLHATGLPNNAGRH